MQWECKMQKIKLQKHHKDLAHDLIYEGMSDYERMTCPYVYHSGFLQRELGRNYDAVRTKFMSKKDKARKLSNIRKYRFLHLQYKDPLLEELQSANILLNVKQHLKDEINSYEEMQDRIDGGEHWENVCDQPEIFSGRNELAESLLDNINKWEKSDEK